MRKNTLVLLLVALLAACGGEVPGADSGSDPDGGSDSGSGPDGGSSSSDGGGAPDTGVRDAGRDAGGMCDGDGDGHLAPECGGDDCDDTNAGRHPSLPELCNGVDEDCEIATLGPTDEDGDGFVSNACCNIGLDGVTRCGPDCDDADNTISPDDAEICDSRDDDCDGLIDEAPAAAACALPAAIATCAGGACAVMECEEFFADCDGVASNGCETDTRTSLLHCGGCGLGCELANASETCAGGACTLVACDAGQGNCDGTASNGCETPTNTLTDCGACATPCMRDHATESCAGGTCTTTSCDSGYGDCDAVGANGCERALNTNTHCGACGTPCAPPNATGTCSSGGCNIAYCNSGHCQGDGSITNGCETDLDTDPACVSTAPLLIDVDGDSADTTSLTASGTGEMWFRAIVRESNVDYAGNPPCEDLGARFSITNAGSATYMMSIRCASCTGVSTSATASSPAVIGRRDNPACGVPGGETDQTLTLLVHVQLISSSGTACSGWTVTAAPNVTTGAVFCA